MRGFVLLTVSVVAALGIGVGIESQLPTSGTPPVSQPSMQAITTAFNTLGTDQRFRPDPARTARIRAAVATQRALKRSAAAQARVLGAVLGYFSGVRYRIPVLAWMVALDRPGLHLPPSIPPIPPAPEHREAARTISQYNLDVIFVNAETGQWLQETEAISPLLPPLPPVMLKG